MSRLGVFGGTFDPIHVGHLAIASAALESVSLDRILFVPARRAPLKDRDPIAAARDRLAMVELAVADEPRFAVSRLEIEREGPSYTVDTLEELASAPAAGGHGTERPELFLILGGDAAVSLARWHRRERIVELATLLVAARPGAPEPVEGDRVIAFDAPRLDISARELRARAARGRSLRYLVPDAVWRYIEERDLYRAEGMSTRTT